jgi:cation diffusion facilitator CzcD-associated flavoprotein CzcO
VQRGAQVTADYEGPDVARNLSVVEGHRYIVGARDQGGVREQRCLARVAQRGRERIAERGTREQREAEHSHGSQIVMTTGLDTEAAGITGVRDEVARDGEFLACQYHRVRIFQTGFRQSRAAQQRADGYAMALARLEQPQGGSGRPRIVPGVVARTLHGHWPKLSRIRPHTSCSAECELSRLYTVNVTAAGSAGAACGARSPRVAVIGAGMSGICMAVTLKRAGFVDVTVYEKAAATGGTWRENTYPGLTCDVPSRFYQYSFALSPRWLRFMGSGPEINDYLLGTAHQFDVHRHIRFNTEIVAAEFRSGQWTLTQDDGDSADYDFLICCTGVLHHPRIPDIPGLADFGGQCFHSARWDHRAQLSSARIGVIGSGSTGVQIVSALADTSAHLTLFQRTAQWILPLPNFAYSAANLNAHGRIPQLRALSYYSLRAAVEFGTRAMVTPGVRRKIVEWVCRINLRRSVKDPELRHALTPDYRPMCKRLVVSTRFYRAIQRQHVELITTAIDHVDARGVVTANGRLHELDVLVLATGFDGHAYTRPMRVTGREGVDLDSVWGSAPKAFQSVSVPGFPNMFLLLGPNSPIGNYSLTAVAEAQAAHVLRWVMAWRDGRMRTVEPTPGAARRFDAEVQAAVPQTVWSSGCRSWYLDSEGRPVIWPWTPRRHRTMLRRPNRRDYAFEAARQAGPTPGDVEAIRREMP